MKEKGEETERRIEERSGKKGRTGETREEKGRREREIITYNFYVDKNNPKKTIYFRNFYNE